ncbi:uncharacterized protein [Nicotiana sylvestris]|uniref:uncharacterized protein n=1 Tax=Nicotiana sylvestris TaxID=4096 RepID=UPI00388C85EC
MNVLCVLFISPSSLKRTISMDIDIFETLVSEYGATTARLTRKNIEERASRSNQAPKCTILSLCTNLESSDHFDCFGFKSGTHRKDNRIWKIEMHTALASLSALIAAIVS